LRRYANGSRKKRMWPNNERKINIMSVRASDKWASFFVSQKKCVPIRTLSAKSVFSFGHPKSGFALTAARDTAVFGSGLYII
jgi:hypothetical protein